jgi:uncharacterized membrane protein YeaQ/YmgE (transglycosylase-associated protein family)
MDSAQIIEQAQYWANYALLWIGFGTVVGLLAKAIMPGRDPGGAIATLAMGVGGTIIGCAVVTYFYQGEHVKPISPLGFVVGTGGAFVILFFYKLLAGYWFIEGETRRRSWFRRPRRYRREYVDA